MLLFRLAVGVCALAALNWAREAPAAETDPQALAQQARGILKNNCYRCHGQDGASEGGFTYVTDLRRLVDRHRVVPGDPSRSRLFKRITDAADPMPPAEQKVRPSRDEIVLLKRWIEAGAPAAEAVPQRPFLTTADMHNAIRADLESAQPRARPFFRYFTLTHLWNAGQSAEELQSYRHGLSKLVNSLSWGKTIVVPAVVDTQQTILRIDLRDYQWNESVWDTIVAHNPYAVLYDTEAAQACAQATRCRLPYVRADWFVAVASRPPLYHEILLLPRSETDLEKMLRVDVRENIRQERVARAGFNGSGVSRNNRLIERHESGTTVYWKSYDFGGNTGKQNLFAHPLGPGADDTDFVHDGGEIIFSLPNGLQAYFLVDGKGQRIDKGPTAIVSDPQRPDRAVENGLSCIRCHAGGIIAKGDQVRGHVVKNAGAYSRTAVDSIMALYPPPKQMAALMQTDASHFQEAVARTGAPRTTTEPIAALAARFEGELDLSLVTAEAGVSAQELLKTLDRFPHLAKQLGPLRLPGGTVQRQVFVDLFHDLVDALQQGTPVVSRNVSVLKLIRQGYALLATDAGAALRAFNRALEIDAGIALAYQGKGDAYRLRGDLTEAIAAYSEALRFEPRSALLFNNRGLAFHQRGDHAKALSDYDTALDLDPRFSVAYHNRGVTHHARGELDRAIVDYSEALRLDDRSALVFNNRGFALFDKGQFEEAIADFDCALRLDPRFAAAFNNRGLAYLRVDKLDRAVADFSAAVRLNAKLASAYFNRAIALARLGNRARADEDRQKAFQLDPMLAKEPCD
jgi:Tfp pilus assembly protein PilF